VVMLVVLVVHKVLGSSQTCSNTTNLMEVSICTTRHLHTCSVNHQSIKYKKKKTCSSQHKGPSKTIPNCPSFLPLHINP